MQCIHTHTHRGERRRRRRRRRRGGANGRVGGSRRGESEDRPSGLLVEGYLSGSSRSKVRQCCTSGGPLHTSTTQEITTVQFQQKKQIVAQRLDCACASDTPERPVHQLHTLSDIDPSTSSLLSLPTTALHFD